jgi:hypothetical protein
LSQLVLCNYLKCRPTEAKQPASISGIDPPHNA